MDWDRKQRIALEKILEKGHDECRKCNLIDDLSKTEYLRKVAQEVARYYSLGAEDFPYKTPYDLLQAVVNILRNSVSVLGLDTAKVDKLKQRADNADVAWEYLAAGTLAVFQKRQVLPKFLDVRELAKFVRSPR